MMRAKVASLVQLAIEEYLNKGTELNKYHSDMVVLLSGEYENKESVWQHLRHLSQKFNILLVSGNEWAKNPEDLDNVKTIALNEIDRYSFLKRLEKVNVIYLPVVSYSLLAKVALTLDDDLLSWLVIQMQLKGKKLIFANDFFNQTTNVLAAQSIKERINAYARQIQKDGISLFPMSRVTEKLLRHKIDQPEIPLLLERHIEAFYKNGTRKIKLTKKSLISPLGKDRARELGIKIERGE